MKKYRIYSGILAAIAALAMTGCGADPIAFTNNSTQKLSVQTKNLSEEITPQEVHSQEIDPAFVKAQNRFALELLRQTGANHAGENVLVSPFSVMQALAMTANGANGSTLAEMEQALGGLPLETLNAQLYTWRNGMTSTPECKFQNANSIWIRNDEDRIQVKPEFLQTTWDFYGAPSLLAAFDEKTCDDINGWISANTDGMIPQILNSIPPEAVMYLVNAVCFDAKWEELYTEEQAHDRDFTAADGSVSTVQMMYSEENCWLHDDHAVGFCKPYQGGKFKFAALLPEEGMSVGDYLATLDPETLSDLLAGEAYSVNAGLPSFTLDFFDELSGPLTAMGMGSAFDESADFTNMAETASGALFINRVLHKTHIEVDLNGTKAAAATVVEMADECVAEEPEEIKTVILDRPFVYMIVDSETNIPVFIGTYEMPQ